jgi:hypothetical protein
MRKASRNIPENLFGFLIFHRATAAGAEGGIENGEW